jgi:sugar phosphate permease
MEAAYVQQLRAHLQQRFVERIAQACVLAECRCALGRDRQAEVGLDQLHEVEEEQQQQQQQQHVQHCGRKTVYVDLELQWFLHICTACCNAHVT